MGDRQCLRSVSRTALHGVEQQLTSHFPAPTGSTCYGYPVTFVPFRLQRHFPLVVELSRFVGVDSKQVRRWVA